MTLSQPHTHAPQLFGEHINPQSAACVCVCSVYSVCTVEGRLGACVLSRDVPQTTSACKHPQVIIYSVNPITVA